MRPIVVFVHLHYLETWPDLSARLDASFDRPFRLVVTTTRRACEISRSASPHLVGFDVIETANRGRDVLPFLLALRETTDFEIGLKLHGKRSVHRLDGEAWREALVGSLLPDRVTAERLVSRIEADGRIGLVGPENSLCSIERHRGGNDRAMLSIAEGLSEPLAEMLDRTPFFSAGTMFWFRREALAAAITHDLADLFAEEGGQTDGTAAHALERLFPALVEAQGFLALPTNVVLDFDADTPADDLKAAARASVDVDETFVRLPGPLAAFVMRRLRFAVPFYLALPKPVRRLVKATAGGALRTIKR